MVGERREGEALIRKGGEEIGRVVEVEVEIGVVVIVLDIANERRRVVEERSGVEEVEIVVVDFLSPRIVCSIPS